MIIGRLTISFDRGTATNQADDLGLAVAPRETEGGKVIRGLGTHFRSAADLELAKERSNEEQRVRAAFKRAFIGSPLPGTYILPSEGAGQKVLTALDPPVRADVQARVSEYVLEPTQALPPAEVAEWVERVTKQIQNVPFGRGKGNDWADTKGGRGGLDILEGLASCPVIGEATRADLLELIGDSRLQRLDRVSLQRRLDTIQVDLDATPVAPRRAPVVSALQSDDVQPGINPRQRRRA